MTGLSIYETTREELQEIMTELDDRAVVDYLLRNPEFFIRNARVVEQMRVPHPVRDTVSLVEWHMARSRKHIDQLEENMTLLMEQASNNESLFYRLLNLPGAAGVGAQPGRVSQPFPPLGARNRPGRGDNSFVSRSLAHRRAVWFYAPGLESSNV